MLGLVPHLCLSLSSCLALSKWRKRGRGRQIAIADSALFTLAAVRTGRGHANILHPLGGSKTREGA